MNGQTKVSACDDDEVLSAAETSIVTIQAFLISSCIKSCKKEVIDQLSVNTFWPLWTVQQGIHHTFDFMSLMLSGDGRLMANGD